MTAYRNQLETLRWQNAELALPVAQREAAIDALVRSQRAGVHCRSLFSPCDCCKANGLDINWALAQDDDHPARRAALATLRQRSTNLAVPWVPMLPRALSSKWPTEAVVTVGMMSIYAFALAVLLVG